jgi:3'5'-cyclic nucleotide phosphodiesterase
MSKLVTEWEFDVLDWTDGELVSSMVDMLQYFNLPTHFKLDMQLVTSFLHGVRRGYRANPYHNFKHGVSVAHVCFVAMARSFSAAVVLSPLDRLATLLSAVCHDVDHPGMNNAFETNSLSPLALRYNDQSVLEMHHAATMFQLLRSNERRTRTKSLPPPSATTDGDGASGGAAAAPAPPATETVVSILGLPTTDFAAFRKMCIAGILATDMTHHNDLTDACRRLSSEASRDMPPKLLVELLVHSADLCNPILPAFRSVHAWAVMVCAEFSAQVSAEKSKGLPFLPHMDGLHTEVAVAKLQCGFIDYVVAPLWNALGTMLPEISEAKTSMARNRAHWKTIVDGTATPASIVEQEEKEREKKLQEEGRIGTPGAHKRSVFVLEDFTKQQALEVADIENGIGVAPATATSSSTSTAADPAPAPAPAAAAGAATSSS